MSWDCPQLTEGQNKDLAASRWQTKRQFPSFLVHLNLAQDFHEVRQIKVLLDIRKTVELHLKQKRESFVKADFGYLNEQVFFVKLRLNGFCRTQTWHLSGKHEAF